VSAPQISQYLVSFCEIRSFKPNYGEIQQYSK